MIKGEGEEGWVDFEGFEMVGEEGEGGEEGEKELKGRREGMMGGKKGGKEDGGRKWVGENVEGEVVDIYGEGYNGEEWRVVGGEEVREMVMEEGEKLYMGRIVGDRGKGKGRKELKRGGVGVMGIGKRYGCG